MKIYFFFIFLLCFSVRLLFIINFPETGGDFDIYSIVAKNILRGCGVSLSDPLSAECILTLVEIMVLDMTHLLQLFGIFLTV